MLDLITNPVFILVLVILVILALIGIISGNLNSKRKNIYHHIRENYDYLESQVDKYNKAVDELINEFVTDETITNELSRLKNAINIDNNHLIDNLINVENTMYNFINNPVIKAEEYTKINDTLTKLYNDNLNDTLKQERIDYNLESTSYNTKLEDFPASIIATIFKYHKLPLFDDSIEKNTEVLNNSASYLSNNYKINQETIKSPEAKKEELNSNLFLAKQSKVEESPAVVIESKPESQVPVANASPEPVPPLEAPQAKAEPVITQTNVEQASTPVEPQNNDIQLVNPIANSFEPISINDNEQSSESPQPINDISVVQSDTPTLSEPITINNEETENVVTPTSGSVEQAEPIIEEIHQEEPTPVVEEPETPTAHEEPIESKPERFCPNCHKTTTEEYCPDCGYPTE